MKKIFMENGRNFLIFTILVFAVSLIFHFRSPNVADPDSLYHVRHAWLYRASVFDTSFPWAYYTPLRTLGSDLWYGFHILLLPFTYLGDLVIGMRIAGAVFTAFLISALGWVMKRENIPLPFLWPFVFLLTVPNALYQILMLRPHILSLALSLLLFAVLLREKKWPVFALAFALAFFHISFFWMGLLIAGAVLLCRLTFRHTSLKSAAAAGALVIAGLGAGTLLRPAPIASLKLAYIQVAQLLVEKQGGAPLLFARELVPLSFTALFKSSFFFFFIFAATLTAFAFYIFRTRRIANETLIRNKVFVWGSLLLSLVFLLMNLFVARRSLVLWVAFGTLFIAGVYKLIFVENRRWKDIAPWLAGALLIVMSFYTIYQNSINFSRSPNPNKLKDAALWIGANSEEDDIVFNTHWDNFSFLFFANQRNYYIGGMDPIFQYAHSPALYWKFHHISKDEIPRYTCGKPVCKPAEYEEIFQVLTSDFKARYVFVEPKRNPEFYAFMEDDPHFEKRFEDAASAVFEVSP